MSEGALKVVKPEGEDKDGKSATPSMKYLIHALVKHGASDLHLKADRPPMYRINGKLVPAKMHNLSAEGVKHILFGLMNEKLIRLFEKNMQVDCSFKMEGIGRFRANIFQQKGTVAGAIRMIPFNIPTIEQLNLPQTLKEIALKRRGLVLITGSTGCGKSTTMASMINHINENRHSHVVTIEDPIEFVYEDRKSTVSQREIGTDAASMYEAVMGSLRQDPDVITIGEMRQAETIQAALTAAETGHLVISTLHTNDAKSTISRIIDVFPADSKAQVRMQLAGALEAVVAQKLVARANGEGRVPVCEILLKSPTIENLILNSQLEKIDEAMSSSTSYYKMQTFNQALEKLVQQNVITPTEATHASNAPDDLRLRLSGFRKEEGY